MPSERDLEMLTAEEAFAWFGFLYVHSRLTRDIGARLEAAHNLSFSAYEVLYKVDRGEARPMRTLAAGLVSISPSRASRVVQDLVEAGYLRRDADQRDGRISLIGLTDVGRELIRAADRTFFDGIREEYLAPLEPDEVATLARAWSKIVAAHAEDSAHVLPDLSS